VEGTVEGSVETKGKSAMELMVEGVAAGWLLSRSDGSIFSIGGDETRSLKKERRTLVG